MSDRVATLGALGGFAGIAFAGALIYGVEPVGSALIALFATSFIGITFVWLKRRLNVEPSFTMIALAVPFGAAGIAVLFATDCAVGLLRAPSAKLMEACVTHSGGGLALTIIGAVAFACVLIMASVYAAIRGRERHGG